MATTKQIRQTFLDYFAKNGHEIVKSSPLVPDNDPTLMFTNAGMVQFKNIFTGAETRDYKRATTTQKCVRAGGKHNDLDNVGYTARHHTFFEMLGNFSFGDYFKAEVIEYAWKLITEEYGLSKDRLCVTVYSEDQEAFDLWKKIAGLSESKIIKIPTSDNFWSMGDTGPCGPCSEIFYDHGDKVQGGPPGSADEDGDRFIEIWNLVFMQYEQLENGERIKLPKPSIDTGMGLERMAAVLQGKHDNYDIDLMRNIIMAISEEAKQNPDGQHSTSHRVVADHLRSSSFLIADGVLPSNEGRGYVLRRIMRRAMRHAHIMGCEEPLMHKLVPTLINEMGDVFPELIRAKSLITETLKLEETKFKQMLSRGLRLIDNEIKDLPKGGELSGETAFKLYDTYGFPLDLTQDALRSQGLKVDVDGFNNAMEKQREEARKSWAGSGDTATEAVWFGLHDKLGATEFLGYSSTSSEAKVNAIVVNGKEATKASQGEEVMIIANQTPFYGESGGQVGDTGTIKFPKAKIEVTNSLKKLGDMIIHVGKVVEGEINVGDFGEFIVDIERRNSIKAHHSVTHLLHKALRTTLGDHVAQKGSLVTPERMRFDFAHHKQMSKEEIQQVENIVNKEIRHNLHVDTRVMSQDDAIESGAMALFGEKYGDEVRVVSMGDDKDKFSVELCGGTHVSATGDIGFFKILSESAIASGVRRIESVAGKASEDYVSSCETIINAAAEMLKTSPSDISTRISALNEDKKRLEKELSDLRKKIASGGATGNDDVKEISGIKYIGKFIDNMPAKELKGMADELKKKIGSGVVAVVTANEGKASLVVGVTDDLKEKISAVELVKVGSAAVGGQGGGGRPDMAQAGGPNGADGAKAVKAIEEQLAKAV